MRIGFSREGFKGGSVKNDTEQNRHMPLFGKHYKYWFNRWQKSMGGAVICTSQALPHLLHPQG